MPVGGRRAKLAGLSVRATALAVVTVLGALVAPVVLVGPASAASTPSTPSSRSATQISAKVSGQAAVPRLRWSKCGEPFLCTYAAVPLDWSHPRGRTISLALIKLPATDRRHRIGSLFVNPGGPGGSGVDMVRDDPEAIAPAVRARFDVIGFDPRFVGISRPGASCMYDDAYAALTASEPPFPVGSDQEAAYAAEQATYTSNCARRADLAFSSTASVARDLDLLRQAVGDPRLSYLGYSYGSYLGQMYAQLFPGKVRAVVVDGVLDAQAWVQGAGDEWRSQPFSARIGSAQGSSDTFVQFLRLCAAAGRVRCAFAAEPDPAAAFAQLADSLRTTPIPLGGGDMLDYAGLVSAVASVLYSPQDWQPFSFELQMLYEGVFPSGGAVTAPASLAAAGAPRTKLLSAARAVHRRSTPSAPVLQMPRHDRAGRLIIAGPLERPQATKPAAVPYITPYDNSAAAFAAVSCEDTRNPDHVSHWAHTARELDEATPYFGSAWTWSGEACATWSLKDPNAYLGPFGRATSAPLLVVSTRYDPATPYAGAVATAKRFPGARLLTVEGYGHTSQAAPSRCADAAVSAYLIAAKLPAVGLRCGQDVAPFSN